MIRVGKVPYCVPAGPMGVIYFGDVNEDTVTNGPETFQFSQLIRNRAEFGCFIFLYLALLRDLATLRDNKLLRLPTWRKKLYKILSLGYTAAAVFCLLFTLASKFITVVPFTRLQEESKPEEILV